MSRFLRVVAVLVVVVAIGFVAYRVWRAYQPPPAAPAAADTTQVGLRAVTLWFADASGDSLVAEVRELPEPDGLHARVAQLVAALAQGPLHHGVGVLPAGTSVLHAYLDTDGLLTLDLSRGFQSGFHGGSRAEDLAVGSLLRTIGENLPEIRRVQLACGGAPIASLGGHLPLDQPLDPRETP